MYDPTTFGGTPLSADLRSGATAGASVVPHELFSGEGEAALLARIALALINTDSAELAVAVTLQEICQATGCAVGEAWLPRAEMSGVQRLHRKRVWIAPDPRLREFAAHPARPMALGEGLPGHAWQSRSHVWAADVDDSASVIRTASAAAAGLRSAVAIPLMAANEVTAVLVLFLHDAHDDHRLVRLVRLVSAVATPLAMLLQQKQIEESHRVVEAKLAGMIAIAADAIVSMDHARNITLFNSGAERIFGYSAEQAVGEPVDMLLPPQGREAYAALIARFGESDAHALSLGQRIEVTGRRKNGELFPAEASLSRFATAGEWTYTMILRDVSDRVRTEAGLRFLSEASAILAATLEDMAPIERVAALATPTLGDICIVDLVGPGNEIRAVAVAAVDPVVEAKVRAFRSRVSPTWASPTPVVQAIRSGEPVLLTNASEWWARAAPELGDHAPFMAQVGVRAQIAMPLRGRGRILGALTLARTSTRPYQATELALIDGFSVRLAMALDNAMLYRRMRDAVASRDEALAVVSHDLRNPLSAISMCLSGLQDDPTQAPELAQGLVVTAQESAELMHRMIQDLLDIASIDAGHLSLDRSRHPIGDVVRHAIALLHPLAADRDLELTLDMDEDTARIPVHADAERIIQVMSNLIGNSCKFTEPHGSIAVRVRGEPGAVFVSVTDTGCGIPVGALPHVFDRFWHARRGARQRSTGLGLAVARGITEAHGGRMWAESIEGGGSTFTFSLPLAVS